ncbi:MAG: tetratricopeptide repeat protein [Flavobacteriales bacterium]|nr:tetratricopeptide repeat protein [Flavobacteriales bacterium]
MKTIQGLKMKLSSILFLGCSLLFTTIVFAQTNPDFERRMNSNLVGTYYQGEGLYSQAEYKKEQNDNNWKSMLELAEQRAKEILEGSSLLEGSPTVAEAHFLYGKCYLLDGKYAEAYPYFKRALEFDPKFLDKKKLKEQVLKYVFKLIKASEKSNKEIALKACDLFIDNDTDSHESRGEVDTLKKALEQ